MTLRRAAAALLLPLLLATALPTAGLVTVRPTGGSHGGPGSTPVPHGAAPPHSAESAQAGHGARTGHGAGESTGGSTAGQRAPHPALLRAADVPVSKDMHGRPRDEATTAAREQAAREQAARAQAAREQAALSAPWDAGPDLKVRLTGDPLIDAANLRRLNAELATAIDPDRVHAGSLADDALADDALARLVPRKPGDAQQRLWRFLREDAPHFDLDHLGQALRPLQGDTLLLMGHIDQGDGALVFKSGSGRPLRLPLALFEQAARQAGVHLMFVGCKSARHASAGFVDNLNGLDAARAMARAMHARPSTLFDLYAAMSGPQRVMEFDPAMFFAARAVEITAGHGGAVVSTLHWSGPTAPSADAAARAASAAAPTPPPAAAQAGPALSAAWAGLSWQMLALALGLLLSCLAGALALWLDGERGAGLLSLVAVDTLAHLLLPPLLLTVFAEAVDGAGAKAWAWIVAVLLLVYTLGLAAMAGDKSPAKAAGQVGAEPAPSRRRMLSLMALRLGLLAALFTAVVVLHTGWWMWPNPAMGTLLAVYSLGRPLPGPWPMLGICLLLSCVGGVLLFGVQAAKCWRDHRRTRQGRAALWRDQLAADGVRGAAAAAAVSARLAFEQCCARPVLREPRWDQVRPMADGQAPDPWAGLAQRHWRLVAVPLLPASAQDEPLAAFGLIRVGSPFRHPLPQALLRRWRAQALRLDELPPLLARVEPRLGWADFAPADAQPRYGAWFFLGGLLVVLFGGIALQLTPGSDARLALGGAAAAVPALLAAWPGAAWVRRRWHLRWLQQVCPPPQPAQPPAQPPPQRAAAAG